MVDICCGYRPAPENRHKPHTPDWCRETEAGTAEGIRCTTPGEGAPVKLLAAWAASAGEGTKRRHSRVRAFVEYPKTGTAGNIRPTPYRAARSLNSVDGESTHPWVGANPVWPEHSECSPHTAISVCSARPSMKQDWTSEPKQETTSAHLCQGGN